MKKFLYGEKMENINIAKKCIQKNISISTAESCTGGLLAARLIDEAGISAVFNRGYITYSNQAKMEELGVCAKTLESFGAVSMETAREMAMGLYDKTHSDICVAITGIAGPDGGSVEKPVGTVHIGVCTKERLFYHYVHKFDGSRNDIRNESVKYALIHINDIIDLKFCDKA